MNISITPDLEKFVNSKVKSGMYQSASEVFREALRLLAERDEIKNSKIKAMDKFIQQGIDSAKNDKAISVEDLNRQIDEIISQVKK